MKKLKKILLASMAIFIMSGAAFTAFAQEKKEVVKEEKIVRRNPPKERMEAIPGLTDEQKKKMKEIHLKTQKDVQSLKNQAEEKKAHLKTLSGSDKPDMNEINKTIDEMMALKTDIMKREAAARQEVRKMLNDEQRLAFDSKDHHHKKPPLPPHPGRPAPPAHQE